MPPYIEATNDTGIHGPPLDQLLVPAHSEKKCRLIAIYIQTT